MTLNLSDSVVQGEINNTSRNTVSGWLEVRRPAGAGSRSGPGQPAVIRLSLTGNLDGNLAGRSFRFVVPQQADQDPPPLTVPNLQWQQIGAMGLNAWRRVPAAGDPRPEGDRDAAPPETPSTGLFLEWFSQNGRMVLKIADPEMEFVGNAPPEPETGALPTVEQEADPAGTASAPAGSDRLRGDTAGDRRARQDEDDDDEEWDLFPQELQLDIRRSAADRAEEAESDDDAEERLLQARRRELMVGLDPEMRARFEKWDEIADGSRDEPLAWLLEGPLRLPRPDDLKTDEEAWGPLRRVLSEMALRGVAFEMCTHFTARQAYRVIIEDLLPEVDVHPGLVQADFVEHFASWDCCPECAAEFEEG